MFSHTIQIPLLIFGYMYLINCFLLKFKSDYEWFFRLKNPLNHDENHTGNILFIFLSI